MKHTSLALYNTVCCSFPWQPQPRKTDRLSEAACCLNFWLQPSATLLVSFIFNDSVNLTRLSLWDLNVSVWACVYVCVCVHVFSSANGRRKQRKGDRSEPIQYGRLSCECPWPCSASTSRRKCAAGIKLLCEVRTPASTENSFTVSVECRSRRISSNSHRWIKTNVSRRIGFSLFLIWIRAEHNLSGHVVNFSLPSPSPQATMEATKRVIRFRRAETD